VNILLAGGAGFIGAHLTRHLLRQRHRVIVLDNVSTGDWSNLDGLAEVDVDGLLTIMEADVCAPVGLRLRLDAVINLASPASPAHYLRHPLETLEAGATGTRRLLELARRDRARFLLASTSEVYGVPQEQPQAESYWGHVDPTGPRSVYDEAKRYAEALASAYARQHGITVRIARIFNTFGPRMRLDSGRVIPTFAGQALCGEPLVVHGDGTQTRSFCYVDDLVAGLDALLWSDVEGPVNLGNPEETSIRGLAERIIELTHSRSPIVFDPLSKDEHPRRKPDISRAEALLGWIPRTPFSAGLEPTLRDIAHRVRLECIPPPAFPPFDADVNRLQAWPAAGASG